MSDKQNHQLEGWVDEGWSAMRVLLDQEMPQERKRRVGLWWWAAAGLLVLLLSAWWLHGQQRAWEPSIALSRAVGPSADLPDRLLADLFCLAEWQPRWQPGFISVSQGPVYSGRMEVQEPAPQEVLPTSPEGKSALTLEESPSQTVHSSIGALTTIDRLNPPLLTAPSLDRSIIVNTSERLSSPWHWTVQALGFAGSHQQHGLGVQSSVARTFGLAQRGRLSGGLAYQQNISGAFFGSLDLALVANDEESGIGHPDSTITNTNSEQASDLPRPVFRELSMPLTVGFQLHPRLTLSASVRPALAWLRVENDYGGSTFDAATQRINPVNQYDNAQQTVWDVWYGAGISYQWHPRWSLGLDVQQGLRSWRTGNEVNPRRTLRLGLRYQIR